MYLKLLNNIQFFIESKSLFIVSNFSKNKFINAITSENKAKSKNGPYKYK